MPRPNELPIWATDPGALSDAPDSQLEQWGWTTSDNTVTGTPPRPNIQDQNGWNNSIYQWINYFDQVIQENSLPLGAIFTLDTALSSYPVPASGVVDSNGFMLCDGSEIPAGQQTSGFVPELTNLNRFIRGDAASGADGDGLLSLSTNNLPAHSHGSGSLASTIGISGNASSTHSHSSGNMLAQVGIYNQPSPPAPATGNNLAFNIVSDGNSFTTPSYFLTLRTTANILQAFNVSTTTYNSLRVINDTGTETAGESISGNNVSGSSSTAGSGNAFECIPNFFDIVHLIRVN